ncbi:Transcription factor GTE1 [Quillaja saponaria]|nr:Transcription factor GTE1 [Quillaja saponaria]
MLLGGLVAPDGHRKIGPDYFGYYTREVIELLSQDEDFPLFANQTSEVPGRRNEKDMGKNTVEHSDNRSDSLFSNGIGTELSDFTKERLRLLLRQGVKVLSSEVDEVRYTSYLFCF